MKNQKAITKFFEPLKRTLEDITSVAENVTNNGCKKLCAGSDQLLENDELEVKNKLKGKSDTLKEDKVKSVALSPQQVMKINENKLQAEIKLQSKRTPALNSNIGHSWFKVLRQEFSKPYFIKLSEFLTSEWQHHTVYPPKEHIYSWTQFCSIADVKVVILGQDPYHGPNQAHGLCFSVQNGVAPPPSLVNMYKELEKDIDGFKHPGHGHLIGWAKQGVLLLNACLTVRAHNANSHKDKGWEQFTDAVIKAVSENNSAVIFLLWGSYAQKKAAVVNKKRHHLLHCVHPSPLSAHRGFFGCMHFSKCNELLKSSGKTPIDWSCLPPSVRSSKLPFQRRRQLTLPLRIKNSKVLIF